VKWITSRIRSLFGFSRTETNAFLILLPLMFGLIFSEPVYRYWFVRQPHDYSQESKQLDSLIATMKWEKDSVAIQPVATKHELFSFDPNKVSKQDLEKLGLSTSLAGRIVNFRSKGGKFLIKKDVSKIYGMDSVLFKKLWPFINLPESIAKEERVPRFEKKEKPVVAKFDLNIADTSQLTRIYGIGPKLSLRIIAFREKLGGFVTSLQLSEIYGLDSVVVQELTSKSFVDENFQPKRISINTATEKELGAHPYIKYKLAKAIVAYRKQHGLFTSTRDLTKISILDEKTFLRLKPYVTQ